MFFGGSGNGLFIIKMYPAMPLYSILFISPYNSTKIITQKD